MFAKEKIVLNRNERLHFFGWILFAGLVVISAIWENYCPWRKILDKKNGTFTLSEAQNGY